MSCPYYSFNDGGWFGGDFWCDKKNERVNSDIYYKYCKGYDYSSCSIYSYSESSGCFITTVACQILGKSDNDEVLSNLRFLRDKVLKNNPKYYYLLQEYDNIGPEIADAIRHDNDRDSMAKSIYNVTLKPVSKMIEEGMYEQAICSYKLMTNWLVSYYGLEYLYGRDNGKDNFDIMKAGHGRKRVLDNKLREVNN